MVWCIEKHTNFFLNFIFEKEALSLLQKKTAKQQVSQLSHMKRLYQKLLIGPPPFLLELECKIFRAETNLHKKFMGPI